LFRLAQQFVARPIDEMKPAAGLAEYRFIGAVWTVRCAIIREPVLHVHAGPGTFEDEAIHPVYQSNDWTVFRIDPCQCQMARGVQPASFATSGRIDRFLDKMNSRARIRPVRTPPQ
jgi:hypothetical protein